MLYSLRMQTRRPKMLIKDWKKDIFTIPNLLSLFRLLLIPVYATIYLKAEDSSDYFLAAAILAVSCLTDMVDGQIARRFNMISTVGKILDPLADKLTQFTLILCLVSKYPILWYLVGLFFVKEVFQVVAGAVNLKRGKMLKGALISGKVCTTVLFLSLIAMVMLPDLDLKIINIITVVDCIFLLIAFADYAFSYYARDSKFQMINPDCEEA